MKHSNKKLVTINPTNKCNLRCCYCMATSGKEQNNLQFIDMDFVKAGIKEGLQGFPTGIKAQGLRYFSPGEPTQFMGCLKESMHFAREINPNITSELQTNGLFNNIEDCKWIAKNIDSVWFSLDGPADINGKNRPDINGVNRTNEIEENLQYVKESTFVGIRATIVEETVDRQDEIVEYYHNLGIKYLCVNPKIEAISRKNRNGNGEVTNINLYRFANGFLKAFKKASELGMHLDSSITFNFDEPVQYACRSCLPMPQLNPDGSLSSCDMAFYANSPIELQCFIYGQWDENQKIINYDLNKINYLQNRKVSNLPKCEKCNIKENCAGGCAGRVSYEVGNIYESIDDYCIATNYLAENMPRNRGLSAHSHP